MLIRLFNINQVLIEAVENHMPQAIVIDEIGTKLEAMAASTIAQRGIQLVATAHGGNNRESDHEPITRDACGRNTGKDVLHHPISCSQNIVFAYHGKN